MKSKAPSQSPNTKQKQGFKNSTRSATGNSNERLINNIDKGEDKSSVLIEIHGKRYRALVDSGAEISVLNRHIAEQFPETECLASTQITLRTATGDAITVAGEMEVPFRLGKKHLVHTFIVADNISRSVIIGRDCLKAHGMKLDFGSNHLVIKGERVPLENDAYLASLVRVTNQRTLRPQTSTVVWGRFKGQKRLNTRKVYAVSGIDTGFTHLEPGLMVTNSVTKVVKQKKFPFLVCNNTNRTITLKRGNVVAQVEEVSGEMIPVTGPLENCTLTDDTENANCEANVPAEHRENLNRLLKKKQRFICKNRPRTRKNRHSNM